MKFGASLVERVGEAVFLQDFNKVDHNEVERVLGFSYSPEQQYDEKKYDYQGQN